MNPLLSKFTPSNDDELNALIKSINQANAKYFDTGISDKRFNTLRDCICEGLGFVHGGYQELKSHWATQSNPASEGENAPDLTRFYSVVGLYSYKENNYIACLSKFIAPSILEALCQHFPQVNGVFGSIDDQDDVLPYQPGMGFSFESYGWSLSAMGSPFQEAMNPAYPVYLGELLIGLASSKNNSDMLNSMLNGLVWNEVVSQLSRPTGYRQDLAEQKKWQQHIERNKSKVKLSEPQYLALRCDSMDTPVLMPFDSIVIEKDAVVVSSNRKTETIRYLKSEDKYLYLGLKFDFFNIYSLSEPLSLNIQTSKSIKLIPIESNVSSLEWFPEDRLEYFINDDDEMVVMDLSKNTPAKIYIL